MIAMEKKLSIPWLVTWMTTLGQAAITLYIPAFPRISEELQLAPAEVKGTLTAFLLGFGLCQFLYGPFSDRYGRKPPLLFGIALFCFACLANVFVYSLLPFLFLRFIQGVGSGSVITLGRAILRDSFNGKELASATSHLSMGFAIGLGASPIIGAYLLTLFGWRSNFLFLLLIGIILLFVIWIKLPETSAKPLASASWKEAINHTSHRYTQILKDGQFWKFLLGGVFAYSVVIAWNILTPFLIQVHFGYSANVYAWMSLLIAMSYYLSAHFNRTLVMKFHFRKIFFFAILLIGLSGLVIVMTPDGLLYLLIPMVIATFGQALIFSNTIAKALQNYSHISGKASAVFSGLQMILVSFFSGIMAAFPETMFSLGLTLIILSFLSFLSLANLFSKKESNSH
jgi:DHA1 family 2-module integral membrane pump EmrD-like MFS transporter